MFETMRLSSMMMRPSDEVEADSDAEETTKSEDDDEEKARDKVSCESRDTHCDRCDASSCRVQE